jgi:TonB family protein
MRYFGLLLAAVICVWASSAFAKSDKWRTCNEDEWTTPEMEGVIPPATYHTVAVQYPILAQAFGREGKIIIRFTVSKEGRAKDIRVLCSEQKGDFTANVKAALFKWRFDPAVDASGRPVDFPGKVLTIRFVLVDEEDQCNRERFTADLPKDVVEPRAIKREELTYPAKAMDEGTEGKVIAGVSLTGSGAVSQVRILCAEPEGVFDAVVTEGLRSWRFDPATKDGAPIDYKEWPLEINFNMPETTEARVVGEYTLTKTGDVANVKIHYSRPDKKFDADVVRGMEGWRLQPVLRNGQAIDCHHVQFWVTFSYEGATPNFPEKPPKGIVTPPESMCK